MAEKLKKSKNTGRSKYPSWLTTDRHELELRQKRVLEEPMLIKKMRGTDHDKRVHPFEIGQTGVEVNSAEQVLWEALSK